MFGSRDKLKARLPPRVPDGERVYAVGDIHGRADLLAQLQEQILADAAGRPPARQTIVYLGDYVDRGPDSKGVIDFLIKARERDPRLRKQAREAQHSEDTLGRRIEFDRVARGRCFGIDGAAEHDDAVGSAR